MIINKKDNYIVYVQKEGENDLEYFEFLNFFRNKPQNPEGYIYKLRYPEMTWELVELQEDSEPTDEERLDAYEILMGLKE